MTDDSAPGPRIAFLFDYGVTVPLCDEDGLLRTSQSGYAANSG